jgi:hypothetical protein
MLMKTLFRRRRSLLAGSALAVMLTARRHFQAQGTTRVALAARTAQFCT